MTFEKIQASMQYMLDDSTTPRIVRETLTRMLTYLKGGKDDDQRAIATLLSQLEDLCADVNIPPYVRTQLYSISSQLEAIGHG